MKVFLCFLVSCSLCAQSLSVASNQSTVRPGQVVMVDVVFSDSTPTASVAGLQWTLVVPPGWTATQAAGPVATAAEKQIACSTSGLLCLLYGLNQNVLSSGVAATATLAVPASATPGAQQVSLSGVMGATAQGQDARLTATGGPLEVYVLSRFDIDGNRLVNAADVGLVADQVVGKTACGLGDVNKSGGCDLIDVLLTVFVAMGIGL